MLLTLLCTGVGLSGCETLTYYTQSIGGHLSIMLQAKPLAEALEEARSANDMRLVQRLSNAKKIRDYATDELGLPDNGSYRRYADLKRPYVVWNVFAAPALSMKLKEWCFPVAGCVTYLGYYAQKNAQTYSADLRSTGLDTYVSGVMAYSTLGYFDDPLLSTFIYLPDGELAGMIFHELAHQRVYVKNDTTFNESFATAVELAGVERWLSTEASDAIRNSWLQYSSRRVAFRQLLLAFRTKLESLYADSRLSDEQKLIHKAQIFDQLREGYGQLKISWGGYSGYDSWFAQPLTNAHLATIVTYQRWVPAFTALLAQNGYNFSRFYKQVDALLKLDKPARDARLCAMMPREQDKESVDIPKEAEKCYLPL